MNETFWFRDPSILWNSFDFWMNKSQSLPEKVNSITRFIILYSVIMSVYKENSNYIYVMIFLLILIYFAITYFLKNSKYKIIKKENEMYPTHLNPYLDVKYKPCTNSTKNNPFSNALPGDHMDRHAACPYDFNKLEVNSNFDEGLYKSDWDVYSKANSQRQYYSMPNTSIPNDQVAFANWLYGTDDNCKTNYKVCTGSY